MPRFPDFFVVGAPKCGTTALFEYLRTHPGVFIPRIKEPNFFCEDFPNHRAIRSEEDYLRLFRAASPTQLVGEASVWYLYSDVAVNRILDVNPDAKFLAMVRNPLEMVPSIHQQKVYSLSEDVKDFPTAWRLQWRRSTGEAIPPKCTEPKHLLYAEVGKLGIQVERLMAQVPPEQVHVTVFDDFVENTEREYKKVLDFVGLPDDGRTVFPPVNEARAHRIEWLARFMHHPPFPLDVVKRSIKQGLRLEALRPARGIYKLNSVPQKRPDLPPPLRQEMKELFTSDVQRLGKLLNRDLNGWLT